MLQPGGFPEPSCCPAGRTQECAARNRREQPAATCPGRPDIPAQRKKCREVTHPRSWVTCYWAKESSRPSVVIPPNLSCFSSALSKSPRNMAKPFLASKALGNLGMLQMQQYHYADAVDLFNATLTAAEKLDAQASIVKTTVNLGWAYLRMGDFERASELFEESEKRSEQLGMITDQMTSLMSLAAIQFVQHQFSAAERDYQQALQLARRVNNREQLASCLIDLAQSAIEKGELSLAEKYNNEALELEHSIGDRNMELYSLVNEAQISAGRQDPSTAERLLRRSRSRFRNRYTSPVLGFVDAGRHRRSA